MHYVSATEIRTRAFPRRRQSSRDSAATAVCSCRRKFRRSLEDIKALSLLPYPRAQRSLVKLYLDEFTEEELPVLPKRHTARQNLTIPKPRPSSRSEKTAISWSCGTVRRARSRTWRCRCSAYLLTASLQKTGEHKRSAFSSQPPATPARQRSRVSVMWTIREFSSSTPTAACPRSRSCRWSARRAKRRRVRGARKLRRRAERRQAHFLRPHFARGAGAQRLLLSSANSINWGRVLPQIVYYISAYCDLLSKGAIALGDKVDFCVPTGNFRKHSGGLLCQAHGASGRNARVRVECEQCPDRLPLSTGTCDRNRPFYQQYVN